MGFEKLDQLPIMTSRQLGAGLGQARRLSRNPLESGAGSQLPACHDRKLIELLNPYSTSKPNQLRGLLSE